MKILRFLYIPAFLSILATLVIYSRIPDLVPTHWDASGTIDTWKPKYILIFTSLLPVGFLFLLQRLPSFAPGSEDFERHQRAYSITSFAVVMLIIALHWSSIAASMGRPLDMSIFIRLLIGIIFLSVGISMPKAGEDHTLGIMTPWTLESEEIRSRTQRAGGRMFAAAGSVIIASLALPETASFFVIAASVFACMTGIFLYSYLLSKRTEK